VKATKIIVSLVSVALLLFVVWFTFRMGMPVYSLAILTVPISIFFMNHQKILYAGIICTSFSKLTFPGLPSTLYIFHLLILLALGIHILNRCITKQESHSNRKLRFYSGLFVLNFVIIILVRGAGLRILGDENWGGMRYAEILIPMGLLLVRPQFVFSPQDWRKVFIWFVFFSMLPFFSEMVFLVSGGAVYHQFYLVNFNMSTLNSINSQILGKELVRFQSANRVGPILIVLASGFFLAKKINPVSLGFYVMGVVLIGLSGHRSALIDLILISFFTGLLFFKGRRLIYLLCIGIFGVFLLLIVYQIAHLLPLTFQRALMLLPNIEVSPEARLDALITLDWRLSLWTEALREIRFNPEYLLLGKGLTYSSREYMALLLFDFDYWWAILTSNYHQGVLSLLIITGIPGLVVAIMMFYHGLKYHFDIQKTPKLEKAMAAFHLAIFIYLTILVFKFFLIYGDVTGSMAAIVFLLFVLQLLSESLTELTDKE
jgi:O-antigen ligase